MDTRAIDINCKYLGISTLQLMENAGKEIAREAKNYGRIAIFCGTGNNGGDGFVAARHLAGLGKEVAVYTFKGEKSDAAEYNFEILQNMDVPIHYIDFLNLDFKEKNKELEGFDCIIDALVGVGISGELREPMKSIVELINSLDAYKIAVDVPTGHLNADIIISFHNPKEFNRGKNEKVADIGIPGEAETYCGPGDVFLALPGRTGGEHKGDFGRLLVIGGSKDYIGAPVLTALGATRIGTDLVFLNCPDIAANRISDPNFIINSFENDYLNSENIGSILKKYGNDFDAVVLGNGISTRKETGDAVLEVIKKVSKPVIIDADALKFIKPGDLDENIIVTPHGGEFKLLFDEDLSDLNLNEKIRIIEKFASETSAAIVLKGEVDIVSNGKQTKINRTGNAGMTVGGTGDVLAGIIGGLIAQNKGKKIFESCCAGVFLCGLAGDLAKEDLTCFRATDVADRIPDALNFCGEFF